jgi:hypothetical protein
MHRVGCRREDHPNLGRRDLLQLGGLSLLGLGLADLLRLQAEARSSPSRRSGIQSVVFRPRKGPRKGPGLVSPSFQRP